MKNFVSIFLSIVFTTVISFSSVHAQEDIVQPTNSWDHHELNLIAGIGHNKSVRGTVTKGELIFANPHDGPGSVAFVCVQKHLIAAVTTKAGNIEDLVPNMWDGQKIRTRYASLLVPDNKKTKEKWSFSRFQDIIMPRKRATTVKLYNSVIRQDALKLKVSGVDEIDIFLPKPNDTFHKFGAECGLGRFKDKRPDPFGYDNP